MKLYVKDVVRKPNDTLYSFLCRVLKFCKSDTFKGLAVATYLDPECINIQCKASKYRSFDEIVLISKTYFKVSDKGVAKAVKKILDNNDSSLVLCHTAKKWVLNYNLLKSYTVKYCAKYDDCDEATDKYGLQGKYSFDDIITLMGLTKEDIKINN